MKQGQVGGGRGGVAKGGGAGGTKPKGRGALSDPEVLKRLAKLEKQAERDKNTIADLNKGIKGNGTTVDATASAGNPESAQHLVALRRS